jgi:PPP family 3-phenylpropionic acid transporter
VNLITLPPKPVIGRGMVNFSSFRVFFKNKPLFLFLIIMFFYGIAVAPLHQFINLYYRDIGANSSLIGTAFFIQAAFEIPFFLIGIKLVRKIGAEKVIVLSMVISLIRLILYGFINVPERALIVGALHGFTISFFLVGVVDYVQNVTPSHLRTTGQALIWAFHFGGGLTL